jgi:hypothetical protein
MQNQKLRLLATVTAVFHRIKIMKKIAITFFVVASLLAQPSHAKDSCKSMLCMAGMIQGSGVVDNCDSAVRNYFSIVKFDFDGDFDPDDTANERGAFLGGCKFDPENWASKINDQFGKMRGFGF